MSLSVPALPDALRWPCLTNSGGPSSRTRIERVSATLLGDRTGHVRCPRVYRLGLHFPPDLEPADPVDYLSRLLSAHGYEGPESLRRSFAIPTCRLIAAPLTGHPAPLDVRTSPPRDVLEQALLLGLCTRHLFDPARPVLWTTASLGRRLELFDPAGFYA